MKQNLKEHTWNKDIAPHGYKIKISIEYRPTFKLKIINNKMMKIIKVKLKSLSE